MVTNPIHESNKKKYFCIPIYEASYIIKFINRFKT